MRLIFALFENPSDAKEYVDSALSCECWTSLAAEDELYEKYDIAD